MGLGILAVYPGIERISQHRTYQQQTETIQQSFYYLYFFNWSRKT